MRRLLGLVFAILAAAFFSSCGESSTSSDPIDKIKANDKLRVGVFSDKPPFGYVDSEGKNQGFDVYISKRIAKDLLGDENKIEFVLVEAASRVEFLRSNKVDIIMANFTKTPERAEVVDFASPYMKVSLGLVSKDTNIRSLDDLKGKKVIVNKGTTADIYFTKNLPEVELLKYEQNTEAFLALKEGRADYLAHDNLLLFDWVLHNEGFAVILDSIGDRDVIAPAVKKGSDSLKQWLDNEIIELTNSGFIKEAYDATLAESFGKQVDSILFDKL